MMRKYLLLLGIIVIALSYQVLYADVSSPSDIVNKYFQAKKDGNIEIIKNLITGPLYQTQKVLLEKNGDYPKFLMNHYEGVKITIEDSSVGYVDIIEKNHPSLYDRYGRFREMDLQEFSISGQDQVAIVIARIQLSDGNSFRTKLLLKYDPNYGWKIYDEIPLQ